MLTVEALRQVRRIHIRTRRLVDGIFADESWARLLIERGIDAEPGSSAGLEGPWIVLSLDAPEERIAEHAAVLAEVARHCPVRLVPSSNG